MLDMEIDAYIHCVSAFIKLAQSEYMLLTEIIPEHHQKKTFDSLIQVSLIPSFAHCFDCCTKPHVHLSNLQKARFVVGVIRQPDDRGGQHCFCSP